MILADEFRIKPKVKQDGKQERTVTKLSNFPVAANTPEKSCFYNKSLSQSFGSRFSHEKYKK